MHLTNRSSRPVTRPAFCGSRYAPYCHKIRAVLRSAELSVRSKKKGITMKYTTKLMTYIYFIYFATGCSTLASGPSFNEAKAKNNKAGYAIVYIYRNYAEPTVWGSTIFIDGKEVQKISQKGFTWVYAKPGKREVTGVWSGMASQRPAKISLNIKENKTYYIELTGISKADLVGGKTTHSGTTLYIDTDIHSDLHLIKAETAKRRISKCCKYQGSGSKYY